MKHVSLLIVLIFVSIQGFAQHLTISVSGESGTSGTNWSISGNVLQIASSGTATIHPSVITNHLTNMGNLTVDLPYVNVLRNININDNILYTGSTNRTLTFKSATDIVVANGISITSSNASINLVLRSAVNLGQRGAITLNAPIINTNGGHFWAGGGNTDVTWNSLIVGDTYARTWTNGESGFSLIGGSVTTNGGDIQMKGYSYYTGSTMGFNNGLKLDNTVVSSNSGSILLDGSLNGKFTNGIACNMEANAGPIIIQSTSGSIQINGNGTDAAGTSSGWRHGIRLSGTANYGVTIKTTSGSILIDGSANYINNTGTDSEGVALFATATDRLKIISLTGAITIKGSNTKENLGQMSNSIRFGVQNVSNGIRIGYDGTTNYSGSILIEGNSIYQRWTNAGTGSISIQTTGGLTIQPSGSSFTYMRAGTDGAGTILTYDDDWNFGTTLSSFTFGKTTNTANITFSNSITTSGAISVYGGDIALNQNITTSANNANVLIKATGQINTNDNRTFQTNNGDIVLWSDSDNSNGGRIWLGLNNVINTANGSTSSGLSGGGKIVLAGGLDNGSNGGVSNDGIPDGFAANSINNGVNLGSYNTSNYTQMYSGGGDIIVRGSTTFNSSLNTGTGLWSSGRWFANSGKGSIQINGTSSYYFGVNFSDPVNNITTGNKHIEFISDKASGNAIEISGSSNGSYGVVFNYDNPKELVATGGGAISITGTGGGSYPGVFIQNTDFLSNSGDIVFNGGVNGIRVAGSGTRLGSRASSSITSSTSAIKWITNSIDLYALTGGFTNNFSTSGTVTVEPSGNSFSSAISFPNANLILANTISGLTVGKSTNSANVNISSATTIAGPISAYGGTIAINQNLSSSANGDILLSANALTFASGKTISSGGKLLLQPQTVATTIGVAGAAGTLQLPATYFTTNFTDGFSSIQIGSSLQTGAISMNGFTLQDPIHFQTSGNLALGGLPILGNNSVTLNAGIASITGTPTNYFKTTGTGKVIRTISNASTFEFPIGSSSYNPLSITNNTGVNDEFSANVMDALYVNGVSGTAVSSTAVNRTWDISKTNANAGSGVDFVFNWNAGDVANGSFYLPELNHFSGSAWEVPVVSSSTVGTNALTVVGYTGTFSPFSIQEGSGLPIELTLFNSNCSEIGTTINWQTASEHHSASFDVEKSRDGNNWSLLESIQAAGNSTTLVDYKVVDSEKATDVVYYRLNQIDLNGESKTFGPISANCFETNDFTAIVFPNPASGMVTVEMNTPIAQTVSIQICGTDGKAIMQTTNKLEQGTTQIPLSVERLKAGVYTVKVYGENTMKTIKLIVQ
jgi:hypothetical protein